MNTEPLFLDQYRIATARLRGYDYGQNGAYFVTICTQGRVRYFGEIEVPGLDWHHARLRATPLVAVAAACWQQIPARFPFVLLAAFVVMPDHVHGLLLIDKPTEAAPPLHYENRFAPQRDNLAAILRGYKAGVTSQGRQAGRPFQLAAPLSRPRRAQRRRNGANSELHPHQSQPLAARAIRRRRAISVKPARCRDAYLRLIVEQPDLPD